MTGSGKTHTMLGDIYHTSTGETGISTLAINELFTKINSDIANNYEVKMSYLEIYNEQVRDLLCLNKKTKYGPGLLIVEDPIKGVFVPELTEYPIFSAEDLMINTLKGNQHRIMGETRANQFSSRSHAIISITIESHPKVKDFKDEVLVSRLSIVDLAGCERAAASENKGLRMYEGGKINRSLLALGNCINMLSDKTKVSSSFIPYRDSKLTRLLKDSLGGNTKTVMIACVSPGDNAYEETVNTLKYAERAKRIQKHISKNIREVAVHVAQYKDIINSLKSEIELLKSQLLSHGSLPPTLLPNLLTAPLKPCEQQEIEKIDSEINKFKEQRENIVGKKEDNVPKTEKEQNLDKISSDLLSRFEKSIEMKQNLSEIQELNTKNINSINKLQEKLQLCKSQKEPDFKQLEEEIFILKQNIEINENIRKDIEKALIDNTMMQKKIINEIQNSDSPMKSQEIIEMQILIRTLTLEKYDLAVTNLELKKQAKISQIDNQAKNDEVLNLKSEIETLKKQLKTKEIEIQDMKLSMSLAISARKLEKKQPESAENPKQTNTRKSINPINLKQKSTQAIQKTKNNGYASPGNNMIINIKNLRTTNTAQSDRKIISNNSVSYSKFLSNNNLQNSISGPIPFTVVPTPSHFAESKKLFRKTAQLNTTSPGIIDEPVSEPEIQNKNSLFTSHPSKASFKRCFDKEKRESIFIKAVLDNGSYTQRATNKKIHETQKSQPNHFFAPIQPPKIAVNLRALAFNQNQHSGTKQPKKAKIVLTESDPRGTGIPIGDFPITNNTPRKPKAAVIEKNRARSRDDARRSISLNMKAVAKLRDRRKIEQTRKLELSLEPMKEVIDNMTNKIKAHLSNSNLTPTAEFPMQSHVFDTNSSKNLISDYKTSPRDIGTADSINKHFLNFNTVSKSGQSPNPYNGYFSNKL